MSAARRLLERLLRRAESARRRGVDEPASLPLGNAAEYVALQTQEAPAPCFPDGGSAS